MKILLLAGEESGVIYANALKASVSLRGAEIRGYDTYGFKTEDLAVFGFLAVLKRIFFFLRVKRTLERAIDEWRPDAVCTIDYPGMNLKLAAYAKKRGIRTVHVVCPQVWAWKAGRIPKIEAALDRLCCFFPFEPRLFKPGFATFVGHPLVAAFGAASAVEKGLVAALPGSRMGEIERHLPLMLAALRDVKGARRIVVPAANGRAEAAIRRIVAANPAADKDVVVQRGGARDVLQRAECAVVASGTATLEAALARCPTVLVYKVDPLLAWFLRHAITGVKHVGLANIIWEKAGGEGVEPMPELLQEDFTPVAVARWLNMWLSDPAARQAAVSRLDSAVRLLEGDTCAVDRIAAILKERTTDGLP